MKRLIAWVMIASLLAMCAPAAMADGATPDEPARSEPEQSKAPVQEQEPSAQPTQQSTPQASETPAKPTPEPSASVQPSPAASETPDDGQDVEPQGQAWTRLEDGTLLDGTLQSVLRELLQNGQSATVYLTRLGEIRVKGIPMELFDEVELEADEDALGADHGPYKVTIEQDELLGGAEADDVPPLIVTVSRVRSQGGKTEDDQTGEDGQDPEESDPPEGEETPRPAVVIGVEASDLTPDEWQNTPPTFTLSGIEPGMPYVYGVFICGERLVLLRSGAREYVPRDEGEVFFRFAIMDMMGDVVSLSEEFSVRLDMTPPDGPYLSAMEGSDTVALIEAWDALSGVDAISFDGGETWEPFDEEEGGSLVGAKGSSVNPGEVLVRDRAGNVAGNAEAFTFGGSRRGGGGGGGSSSGGKRIKHVKETMDYSLANYNALDLVFPEGAVTELIAGDTALSLSLAADVDGETRVATFTAELVNWRADDKDERTAPNALVLTAAQEESELNTWLFSGDVYRMLYNSGVDYLVFASGDYIAALSTAGFTGGTAYAKLKAGGMSTKRFAYTLCQDEALRETTLCVEVGGETYLLEEDRAQPMYRYDVLIGTREMMAEPFANYLPKDEAGEEQSHE